MKFNRLVELFREHANELAASSDVNGKFRSNAYRIAADTLAAEAKGTDNVTKRVVDTLSLSDYMKKTAVYVAKNGVFDRPKKPTDEKQPAPAKEPLLRQLTDFMGIGKVKAEELIEAGLKSINEIHMKKYKDMLTDATKLFLDKRPLSKIPHDDIRSLEPFLTKFEEKEAKVILVGSYRRKTPFSSDIDVMIVSSNADVLVDYKKAIASTLNVYPYSAGADKVSMIVDARTLLKKSDAVYKIDAFRTNPLSEIPMLLYSTGSKEFNIRMRSVAKKRGLLLNQNGLYEKQEDGGMKRVPNLNSERAYFDYLGMTYKEPVDRQ